MNDTIPRPTSKLPGIQLLDLEIHRDARGATIELWRSDMQERFVPAMMYYSFTLPNQQRGPHSHMEQTDCFAFIGPGDFEVHLWEEEAEFPLETHEVFILGASRPAVLIIPPGIVHGYRNISPYIGVVVNMPNKLYRGEGKVGDVDEVRYENSSTSIFKLV